ncbi:MAG: class I SAM-dependent methyltransferase [Rickettsiales bacterium]|jgi:SAM-dependent methyltransferase|nr:class I SAM-dependent methyltransferase [Rickettsiales bacterium]
MKKLSVQTLVKQAFSENLTLPPLLHHKVDNVIPTMNKKGFMCNNIYSITEEFISRAASGEGVHLEIGSAYGNIAVEALKRGCTNYIANDLDIRHLKILSRIMQESYPNLIDHLHIIHGFYPNEVDIESESIDSILISRVLHFLSPEQIFAVVKDMYRILKPGGKIYVLCISPYNTGVQKFIPVFEEAKKRGEKYPGYTTEKWKYMDEEIIDKKTKESLELNIFNFFDLDSYPEYFNDKEFQIEKSIYIPYEKRSVFSMDGRETTGAVIIKR